MYGFLLRTGGMLALCLTISLGALPAWGLTGPEVAGQLNQAWASTPEQCVAGRPAYYCSGVMLNQRSPTDPLPFWTHGPDAIARGAERFDYLREDVAPGSRVYENGYIFADRFTAIGQHKDYQLQGDDGMGRPPELLVSNWGAQAPTLLPVKALFHRRSVAGLKAALRDQRTWFEATGEWLPVLRLATDGGTGQRFGFDRREQVYSGYAVAARLNARFSDTTSTCREGKSALHCNGVIIRGTAATTDFHAWDPSPNSEARDGVSFSVVRSDVGTVNAFGDQGLIFQELSKPSPHSVRFRCLYPANASTSSIPNSCRPTCLSENISTVDAWRARYGTNPGNSCTFGDTPAEVQLNTDVRKGQEWAKGHNELIIGAWPEGIPAQLPIEAFFFESDAGKAGARFIQNDYLQQSGIFVPIVRVSLAAAPGSTFVFDPADQSY